MKDLQGVCGEYASLTERSDFQCTSYCIDTLYDATPEAECTRSIPTESSFGLRGYSQTAREWRSPTFSWISCKLRGGFNQSVRGIRLLGYLAKCNHGT